MLPSLQEHRAEPAAAASGCHIRLCSVLPTAVPGTAKQGTQTRRALGPLGLLF